MSIFKAEAKDGVLVLSAFGRIDSTNAPAAEQELEEAKNGIEHTSVVFDAENLQYISSAGLRIVLRLRKAEPTLKVINASSDVYEVFEMTGFTEMIPVSKAYRVLSVDGCEIIGKGAKGTVYRYDPETIVKVYHNPDSLPDIQNERELARKAFVLGIPTAISYDIVKVGDSYGSVFELLNAKSFSQLILEHPEKLEDYIGIYADLLRTIHKTAVKEDDMPDIKTFVLDWCNVIENEMTEDEMAKIRRLIREVPDSLTMLHCDYHTNNVMMQNDEALLIDMDTLSHGHPVFELANVYITYVGFGLVDPGVVEQFLGLPYPVAKRIWEVFLPRYFETDDSAYLEKAEEKIRLVAFVRLMRHTLRRGIRTENDKKTVELAKASLKELLKTVDTLEF